MAAGGLLVVGEPLAALGLVAITRAIVKVRNFILKTNKFFKISQKKILVLTLLNHYAVVGAT